MKPFNKTLIFLGILILGVFSFCFLGIISAQEEGVPDLVVTALDAQSTASTQQQIEVSWTVSNQGDGDAIASSGWYDALYFSTDYR